MSNYNKVFLMGNLTKDPELSYTTSQTAVCQLSMAINRSWTDQDGTVKEETCYVDCVAFGSLADTLSKYMKKGMPIFIDGRLNFSSWVSSDGSKRSKLKVIIEKFEFLSGGRKENHLPVETPNEKDIIPF